MKGDGMLLPYKALQEDTRDDLQRYISEASQIIDNEFGTNYAKKNPAMVASIVQSLAYIYNTNCMVAIRGECNDKQR